MSPAGWNSPVSAFMTINHSGCGSLVLCAVTAACKMTVKMRTTPAKEDFRSGHTNSLQAQRRNSCVEWRDESGQCVSLPRYGLENSLVRLTFSRTGIRIFEFRE